MEVKLLHNTPLWVASKAIRKCWASEAKSDNGGTKDKELIERIGNKNKHKSTLEHLVYSFDIDGISRACLQELARHRIASYSVKSSRYTLKEIKNLGSDVNTVLPYFVSTGNKTIDETNHSAMIELREALKEGISNDEAKYLIPEAYKTSLVMTINARSLQNFLELRSSSAALWEIRLLAQAIYDAIPDDHKYLFKECMQQEV
jgi:thymidylate synthase (FAD)